MLFIIRRNDSGVRNLKSCGNKFQVHGRLVRSVMHMIIRIYHVTFRFCDEARERLELLAGVRSAVKKCGEGDLAGSEQVKSFTDIVGLNAVEREPSSRALRLNSVHKILVELPIPGDPESNFIHPVKIINFSCESSTSPVEPVLAHAIGS